MNAGAGPTFGGMLTQTVSSAAATVNSPLVMRVIYVLVIGIIVSIVVMVADSFWHFLPINPVSGPSAAARAGKTFWSGTLTDTENLLVAPGDSPTVVSDTYTMSITMVIGDTRTPNIGKFRHVLHRGANPCGLTTSASGPSGHAGIKVGDIPPTAGQQYIDLGLPSTMNPGLFLDRYKNDLHIFIHTRGTEDGNQVLWLESATVADLPLDQPITIGVICNGTSVEIYVNCKLYSTMILRGKPYLPPSDNMWFGRYCAYPMSGLIKNLQLWGDALSASDYMAMCGTGNFNGMDMPSSCPTAGSGSSGATTTVTSKATAPMMSIADRLRAAGGSK
jgi:hypothetical protein